MARSDLTRVCHAVSTEVWAIDARKADLIEAVLEMAIEAAHDDGAAIDKDRAREIFGASAKADAARSGAVAVLPLYGVICHRAGMLAEWSGGISCERFGAMFDAAMTADDVSVIVIDCTSPGGTVAGVPELAAKVYAARGRKTVIAVANHLMASAAVWICAAADEVVAIPSAEVGCLGAQMIHVEYSAMDANDGVKRTRIVSDVSPRKNEANSFEPLTPEAEADLRATVNEFGRNMLRDVAAFRGVTFEKAVESFGQGRVLTAAAAKRAGLVDRIATMEAVLAELGVRVRTKVDVSRFVAARGTALAALPDGHPLASRFAAAGALGSPITAGPLDFLMGAVRLGERAASVTAEAATTAVRPWAGAKEVDPPPACPDCDEPMEDEGDEWYCPSCKKSHPKNGDSEEAAAASAAGGAAPDAHTNPAETARAAEETSAMSTTAAVAPGGGAEQDQKSAATITNIRALAKAHNWSDDDAFALATSGMSEAEAATEIHKKKADQQKGSATRVTGVHDRMADNPAPFRTLGEQLACVISADKVGKNDPSKIDSRLHLINERVYGSAGQNSTIPSDGGWALQPTFVPGLLSKTWKSSPFLERAARSPVGEGSDALVRNRLRQRSLAKGARFGGIQVYRTKEGKSVDAMKAEYKPDRLELEKLMGIMFVTSEQQRDGVQLQSEAERYVPLAFRWQAEFEMFDGTGVGEMLGVRNSPALVTVAKESGQAAGTVLVKNLLKLLAVLPDIGMDNAVWAIHRTVLPELGALVIGNQPVFVPNGNVSGRIFGTLYGLPVAVTEFARPLGEKGDVGLYDFGQYTVADKAREAAAGAAAAGENFEMASSIHVRFLTDEEALRWTWRVNGQPDWDEPLTDLHGTNLISPYAVLEAR